MKDTNKSTTGAHSAVVLVFSMLTLWVGLSIVFLFVSLRVEPEVESDQPDAAWAFRDPSVPM